MKLAKRSSSDADALRPVVKKLSQRANQIFAEGASGRRAGEILRQAWDWLMQKMAPEEERRQKLQLAFGAVVAEIHGLPVVRSAACFEEAESKAPGTGEVFSLAINPRACKACMACVEECPEEALRSEPQTLASVNEARSLWRLYEEMPDPSGATIDRLRAHPEIGLAAGLLLSRHCLSSMAGGDMAEAGSGEKIALHLTLAACEYHMQPILQRKLGEVDDLAAKCEVEIRELLASALPDQDLDGLAERVHGSEGRHVELMALIPESGTEQRIDRARLQRLVDLARELRVFANRLRQGRSGLGRARAGMVLASGRLGQALAEHPYNPFALPVVFDSLGESAQLAQGLMAGQLSGILDDVLLMRRCRRELERPNEAASTAGHMPGLHWEELSAEERELCPPILLVGDEGMLGSRGLSQLTALLSEQYPLLVLSLNSLDSGVKLSAGAAPGAGQDLAALAAVQGHAFVLESSIAHPPQRDGFPSSSSMARARAALESGVQTLFRYDPRAEGVFGLRFDLSGNDLQGISKPQEGESETPAKTFADWAASEGRFALCFPPLVEDAPSPTPLAEYMAMPVEGRVARTPFICLPGEGSEEGAKVAVSEAMVAASESRRDARRMLLELAGVVTPFTKGLREDLKEELAQQHAGELQAQAKDYENKLQNLRAELQAEFTTRVKNRLMALALRQGRPDSNGGRGT
jgi:pyruvate-ferredoxin/flavodoxin oxidoreductase